MTDHENVLAEDVQITVRLTGRVTLDVWEMLRAFNEYAEDPARVRDIAQSVGDVLWHAYTGRHACIDEAVEFTEAGGVPSESPGFDDGLEELFG